MIQPIIMCKAPVEGEVKTRLIPAYTPRQASEIHMAMASAAINRCARLFPHTWIAANDMRHEFFRQFGLRVAGQGDGDLGQRMARLLTLACREGAAGALFLGIDSPHMAEARILRALREIDRADVVIGPVEDGGYDLIALGGCHVSMFERIDWGGSRVCEQSLAAADAAGLSVRLLSVGFDVDQPDDVPRAVRAGWSDGCRFV
ncbi:MAG: TIGR04282 family arsenosugar biosynthesis glycosyltransferase [Mariprofundaceae bacterium]